MTPEERARFIVSMLRDLPRANREAEIGAVDVQIRAAIAAALEAQAREIERLKVDNMRLNAPIKAAS